MADEISLLPKYLERDITEVVISQLPKMKWYEYETFDVSGAKLKLTFHYIGGMTTTAEFDVTSSTAPEKFLTAGEVTFNLVLDNEPEGIHVEYPITVEVYERWIASTYVKRGSGYTKIRYYFEEEFHHSDVYWVGVTNVPNSPEIRITDFESDPEDGTPVLTHQKITLTLDTFVRDENFNLIPRIYTDSYILTVSEKLTGLTVKDLFFKPHERIDWENASYYEVYNNGDIVKKVQYGEWTAYLPTQIINNPSRLEGNLTVVDASAYVESLWWNGKAYGPVNDYLLTDNTHTYGYSNTLSYYNNVLEIDAPWVVYGNSSSTYAGNNTLRKLTLDRIVGFTEGDFSRCLSLNKLYIPRCELLTVSFEGCSFTSVEASSLKEIGNNVFRNCRLNIIYLPELLTAGNYAFQGARVGIVADKLEEIGEGTFKDATVDLFEGWWSTPLLTEIPEMAFQNTHLYAGDEFTLEGVTTISDYAFDNSNSPSSLILNFPEAISVGDYAFTWYPHQGDSHLYNILLPKVETIGAHAFDHRFNNSNYHTDTLNFPKCIDVGEYAFKECEALEKVNLGACEAIHNYAFNECRNLIELKVTAPRCQLGNWVFEYEESDRYVACNPNLIVWVPNRYKNDYKTDSTMGWVYIASHIHGIGEGVVILDDDTIIRIEDYEWSYLNDLRYVILNNCIEIGNYGFYNDSNLETFELPKVESIGDYAFYNNFLLESLHLPNAETIGDHAFGCNLDEVPVGWRPKISGIISLPNCRSIGEGAFASYRLGGGGGVSSWATYQITNLNLPLVEEIGDYAFVGSQLSGTLSLPNLETVGKYTFRANTITNLLAPNLKSTALGSFSNSTRLTTLDLPSLETVDTESFYNCTALTSVSMPKLTSIGRNAFWSCNALVEAVVGTEVNTVCVGNYTPFPTTIQSIWVKDELVDAYKADRFWSSYTSVIKPISERVSE